MNGFCIHLEKGRPIHHYCPNILFKTCELYTLAKGIFIFKEIKMHSTFTGVMFLAVSTVHEMDFSSL